MSEKDKRIVIRVASEEWTAFDDKRHSERTTFQELGLRLFQDWFAAAGDTGKRVHTTSKRDNINETRHISLESSTELERACILDLLNILRSGNEVAILAIKSNLLAFAGYVHAVPEAPGGFADLTAHAAQLALIDQSIMDAAEAAKVGGRPVTPPHGRVDEKEARRSGTASGIPRKKVR